MISDADREQLILSAQGLVKRIARQVSTNTGADFDELVSDGYLGAIDAADRYNPELGCTFSTYAAHRVRGAIIDGIRDRDHLSRSQRRRAGDDEDVRWMAPISLDLPIGQSEMTLGDVVPTTEAAFDDVIVDTEAAHWAVKQLAGVEYDVIVRHYWGGTPLHEIGDIYGVTESRACQIEMSAMHQMRVAFLRSGLDVAGVTDNVARIAKKKRGRGNLSATEHGALFNGLLEFWVDA